MRDRQILSREVEFLQQQMVVTNDTDYDKQNVMYSSRHRAVQEIINTVKQEDDVTTQQLLKETHAELDVAFVERDLQQAS